jgi:hypothetical protein
MATAATEELQEAALEDVEGLTLADIRRRLLEHGRWKVRMAESAAALMVKGYPHHRIRAELGLTGEQYRHVRRWLRMAMRSDVSFGARGR